MNLLFVEIVISFVGNDKVVLQENVSTFFFQLKAQGSYARPFQVAVICFDPATEFPAKGNPQYIVNTYVCLSIRRVI